MTVTEIYTDIFR